MNDKYCVYCGKKITQNSREHVIHNALGGLLESVDICCPECNNYVSKHIDVDFTTIFNPIVGNIPNLAKSHNKNSVPSFNANVLYEGKKYTAIVKGGKIVACPELSRALRCDISKIPVEVDSYNFDLNNKVFQTGIAKIAFNYAMSVGVDFNLLRDGLKVHKSGKDVTKIEYNYPLVPFCPMNTVDTLLELGTPTELYHSLILFSQHNQLWCYVDLFNTFQYYVLLSDKVPEKTAIHKEYAQSLTKVPRPEDIDISSPKDAIIYAQQYGVEPTMDKAILIERIRNAEMNKKSINQVISKKLPYLSPIHLMQYAQNQMFMGEFMRDLSLYFDNEDNVNTTNFRIWTPTPDGRALMSYPDAILQEINDTPETLKQYTYAKFNKLNTLLCKKK